MQVMRLREEVKSLAEDAQGDIGLDYAWLDDVTYTDWQRYHDLERSKLLPFSGCYEKFLTACGRSDQFH